MNAFDTAFNTGTVQLAEYGEGLDTLDAIVAWICDEDNDGADIAALRCFILAWAYSTERASIRDWREWGRQLVNMQIPANWDAVFQTYAHLAEDVFVACARRLVQG